MCTHRPECPAIDDPGAHTACVVVHHADLGWSMLCNGAIVLDAIDQAQPQQRRTPPRRTRTIRSRRQQQQQPVAA